MLTREDHPHHSLLRSCGFSSGELRDFGSQLRASAQPSVDAFLEHRKEFLDLGKCAIAAALIPYEQEDRLLTVPSEEDWYRYLFQQLDTSRIGFSSNQLSIVTFNYDRSLEAFWFRRCLAILGPYSSVEAAQRLPKVVHMYGSLGPLPSSGASNAVKYGVGAASRQLIELAVSGLQLVGNPEQTDQFDEAKGLIEGAFRVFFLGFAFNEDSLTRLRPERVFNLPLFEGTAYEEPLGRRGDFERRFSRVFDGKPVSLEPCDCRDFIGQLALREFVLDD